MKKNTHLKEVSGRKVTHITDLKDIIKKNDKGRALLATAILEDESVRLASQANSKAYLKEKWEREDRMSEWMWNLLYFALGMLFVISMENVFWNMGDFIIK